MKTNCFYLLLFFISTSVHSQTYLVKPELQYTTLDAKVYETLSGLTIKTDPECVIPDYAQARLRYNATSGDRLIYSSHEYFINSEGELDEQNVERYCQVIGVIGAGVANVIYIENNSIYDSLGQRLYLYNIRLFEGVYDTGTIYSSAILKLTDGLFEIQELKQ